MKKSVKKTVEYLKRFVGQEVLRTKRTLAGDRSYKEDPVIIVGFTKDGHIIIRYTGVNAVAFRNVDYILPPDFTDRNWTTKRKALKAKNSRLNQWKGKKVKRIRPTDLGCRSFMCDYDEYSNEPPILISASKFHVVVRDEDGTFLLGFDYADPADWVLAE